MNSTIASSFKQQISSSTLLHVETAGYNNNLMIGYSSPLLQSANTKKQCNVHWLNVEEMMAHATIRKKRFGLSGMQLQF